MLLLNPGVLLALASIQRINFNFRMILVKIKSVTFRKSVYKNSSSAKYIKTCRKKLHTLCLCYNLAGFKLIESNKLR